MASPKPRSLSRAGGSGRHRRGAAEDPAPAPELQIPGCLSDSRSLPLLLPPSPSPAPRPLLFWLEALGRSFRESLGRNRSWPDRGKGRRKGRKREPGEGGIGAEGPAAQDLPRARVGEAVQGERGGTGQWAPSPEPSSRAAGRLDPPPLPARSGGCRPALGRCPGTCPAPAARGTLAASPSLPASRACGEVTRPPPTRGKERIVPGAPKPRASEREWAARGALCVCARARAA